MKPEIFHDKEGKPQISMDIRAIDIQVSPFGKPEQRSGSSEYGATAQPTSTPPFGMTQEPVANPYMGGYSQAGVGHDSFSRAPAMGAPQGQTFDDEVPF